MPFEVSGYVLAGGKSSRMGRDKALIELNGRSLVELAVDKLKVVCRDVHILSSRLDLGVFAPLVADVHPGCGPMSGVEAALLDASCLWSLFVPVDMPFLEVEFLREWLRRVLLLPDARIALFTIGERPQPTLCMLHREVLPFVQRALEEGRYKMNPMLETAGKGLAAEHGRAFEEVFLNRSFAEENVFANINTPEEFAEAEQAVGTHFVG